MKSANMGGSIISKNILQNKGKIKWCIKEKPRNNLDNGWRFLSDIDTNEYLSDAKNMAVVDWNTVIEFEPAMIPFFDLPVGTELTIVSDGVKKKVINSFTGDELII